MKISVKILEDFRKSNFTRNQTLKLTGAIILGRFTCPIKKTPTGQIVYNQVKNNEEF